MAAAPETTTVKSPVDLTGKWRLDRKDNFNEYMKAVGIGMIKRKLISSLTPVLEIHQNGAEFTVSTKTSAGSRSTTFTLGVEYSDTNAFWGGKEQRVLAEWQGTKLVQRVLLAPGDDVPKSFEREIVDGELVFTTRSGEIVGKRYFKKM